MREGRRDGTRVSHELAEVRFDARSLLQAHEVGGYRHALTLVIARPVENLRDLAPMGT
jgi:hypothetical protein